MTYVREVFMKHVLFLTYHLPLSNEPGAFRPWMEARLLKRAGFSVTVITSGVHYMTGEDTRPSKKWCSEEWRDGIRILKTWAPSDHRHRAWKGDFSDFRLSLSNRLTLSLIRHKITKFSSI